MDQNAIEAINALANALATDKPGVGQALVTLLVLGVVSAVSAFSGAYLVKRGQNLATKDDFESLQKELAATTLMTAQINTSVGFADWKAREINSLRRTKVEQTYEQLQVTEEKLNASWRTLTMGGQYIVGDDGRNRLRALFALYFPDHLELVELYATTWSTWITEALQIAIVLRNISSIAADSQAMRDAQNEKIEAFYEANLRPRLALHVMLENILTSEMKRLLAEQTLGFVETYDAASGVAPQGT
jgi:hypothetical protein